MATSLALILALAAVASARYLDPRDVTMRPGGYHDNQPRTPGYDGWSSMQPWNMMGYDDWNGYFGNDMYRFWYPYSYYGDHGGNGYYGNGYYGNGYYGNGYYGNGQQSGSQWAGLLGRLASNWPARMRNDGHPSGAASLTQHEPVYINQPGSVFSQRAQTPGQAVQAAVTKPRPQH